MELCAYTVADGSRVFCCASCRQWARLMQEPRYVRINWEEPSLNPPETGLELHCWLCDELGIVQNGKDYPRLSPIIEGKSRIDIGRYQHMA